MRLLVSIGFSLEKCWKIISFSGRLRPIGGNTAWGAMARLGSIGALDGGSRFHMSILRNGNVALSNLRNAPVTMLILRNDHVPCHYLFKAHVACH